MNIALFGNRVFTDVIKFGGGYKVKPQSNITGVLIRGKFGEWPCDNRGRDLIDVATSQGKSKSDGPQSSKRQGRI